MKTSLFGIFLALAAMQQQTPQQPAPLDAANCKCSIEVIVKRAATGEPIPDFEIQLRSTEPRPLDPGISIFRQLQGTLLTVKTTTSGRAEFRDLAEGLYTVVAEHQGDYYFEGTSVSYSQSSVYVGPREKLVQQVSVTVMTGGSVSGQILDSDRQPVRTAVSAYQLEFHNGQRSLVAASTGEETNELGEYRLTRLRAGEYYIRTLSPAPQQNQTYYPGVLGPTSAVRVAVQEGQELAGINFAIPSKIGVMISGTITNAVPGGDSQPDGKLLRTVSSLYLVPRDTGFYFDFPQEIPNKAKGSSSSTNGTEFPFEIHNVPPGSYDLYPLFVDTATDGHSNRYMSPTRIEVGTEDIQNIRAVIRNGATLTIRASRDSSASAPTAPRPDSLPVRLNLIPKDSQPSPFFSGRSATNISLKPDSWLLISDFMEGRYFVSVQLVGFLPSDYVSDIRQGLKSVFDEGYVTLSSDSSDSLELIVRSEGGTIQGRVNGSGKDRSPSPVTVTLIPDPPRRQNLMLYKSAAISPSGNGNFNFTGLAPGTYRIFAWGDLPGGAEQNTEFMSEYESRGISVTVGAGLTLSNIEVPLIRAR